MMPGWRPWTGPADHRRRSTGGRPSRGRRGVVVSLVDRGPLRSGAWPLLAVAGAGVDHPLGFGLEGLDEGEGQPEGVARGLDGCLGVAGVADRPRREVVAQGGVLGVRADDAHGVSSTRNALDPSWLFRAAMFRSTRSLPPTLRCSGRRMVRNTCRPPRRLSRRVERCAQERRPDG